MQVPLDERIAQLITFAEVHAARLVQNEIHIGDRCQVDAHNEDRDYRFDCYQGEGLPELAQGQHAGCVRYLMRRGGALGRHAFTM